MRNVDARSILVRPESEKSVPDERKRCTNSESRVFFASAAFLGFKLRSHTEVTGKASALVPTNTFIDSIEMAVCLCGPLLERQTDELDLDWQPSLQHHLQAKQCVSFNISVTAYFWARHLRISVLLGLFVGTIFAGAFAFGIGFDTGVTKFWDHWNKGVRLFYCTARGSLIIP